MEKLSLSQINNSSSSMIYEYKKGKLLTEVPYFNSDSHPIESLTTL